MRQAIGIVVASIVVAACGTEGNTPTEPRPPSFEILDALHNQGNPRFFLLPPMVPSPATTGMFDSSLSPTVAICEMAQAACGVTVASYTMTSGSGSELVRVDPFNEHYAVNWHTDQFSLDLQKTYRITISVSGLSLGHADVAVVATGKELKNINTGEFVPLKDGRTLPIKFRIDQGIFPLVLSAVSGDGQSALLGSVLPAPIVARLTDAGGYPVGGYQVSFAAASGSGEVIPVTGTTGADGVATATWTLGSMVGLQTVEASAANTTGPVTFSAAGISPLPSWCDTNINFDDGTVPVGWGTLVVRGGPGLINGRVEGHPTDSGMRLDSPTEPAGPLSRVIVEYDASSVSSFWGMNHGFTLETDQGVWWFLEQTANASYGPNNLAFRIDQMDAPTGAATTVTEHALTVRPYTYGDQHYRIEITNGLVQWTVTNLTTAQVVSVSQTIPATLLLTDVHRVYWDVYTTTGSITWGDNLTISCQ